MRTWEDMFKSLFPSALTVCSATGQNPETFLMGFMEQMVQQGKVQPRKATDEELKALEQQVYQQWRSEQAQ